MTNLRASFPRRILPGPENQAVGRPATQSSEIFGGAAHLAVDGLRDQKMVVDGTPHCVHTNKNPKAAVLPAWWQVDMEQAVSVARVVIYNRADCCGEAL